MAATGFISTVTRTVALAAVLFAGAGVAQAADSNDRIVPPSPADVAMLRALLSLQHPSLRQSGTVPAIPAAPTAGVVSQHSGQQS